MQYGDQGDKHLKARYQNAHLRPMKTMQEDKKKWKKPKQIDAKDEENRLLSSIGRVR